MLEKTLESPLDSNEIKPVNLKENQPWIFIGRTDAKAEAPVLWPPMQTVTSGSFHWKIPWCEKDWGKEEKGMTEDEMAGWHHRIDGCEFEWTPGVGDGQGGLAYAIHGVTKSRTRLSDWTELKRVWGEWEVTANVYGVSFWSDENVLELDSGICKYTENNI